MKTHRRIIGVLLATAIVIFAVGCQQGTGSRAGSQAKGEYAAAQDSTDSILNMANQDVSMRLTSLKNRAAALEKKGRYHEAYDYMLAYVELHDSVTQADNRAQQDDLNQRYQLNELKSENDLLLHRSRFTTGGVAMILGILALLAFLAFNGRWTRRLSIKNQQLERERNVVVAKNKQLAVERDRAETASKAKTAFIRSMTHEIRTPLNAISGFSQIMAMDDEEISWEERADMSRRIMKGTRQLTNILDDLILISDFESRTGPLPAEDCPIVSVVHQVISSVEPLVPEGVTLRFQSDMSSEQKVKTNARAVCNILSKLLDNAVKFTSQGHITLTAACHDGKLHFAVSDTGPGIPKDKRNYIFERFAKLDSFSQGAGLGLTAARLLAEHLGGTLTLDTDYTEGAKFDLFIPIT